jgi:hypothetical protein
MRIEAPGTDGSGPGEIATVIRHGQGPEGTGKSTGGSLEFLLPGATLILGGGAGATWR